MAKVVKKKLKVRWVGKIPLYGQEEVLARNPVIFAENRYFNDEFIEVDYKGTYKISTLLSDQRRFILKLKHDNICNKHPCYLPLTRKEVELLPTHIKDLIKNSIQ
jgi:hypothetical protein